MYAIGIDIGGTTIKVGLVDGGKIINSNRKPTASTPEEAVANIVLQIDALFEHYHNELRAVSKVELTREEFDAVVAFRNRLVHPAKKEKEKDKVKVSLTLSKVDVEFVAGVLRRFGCLRAH